MGRTDPPTEPNTVSSAKAYKARLLGGPEHGLVYGRKLKRYQCRACGHQATLTAGTIMRAT